MSTHGVDSVERSVTALRHINAVLATLQDHSPRSFLGALAGDPRGEIVDAEYVQLLDVAADLFASQFDHEVARASAPPAKRTRATRKSIAMHELGNALGTVVLTAQLGLELGEQNSPLGPNAFESIHRAATRMRVLVAELRDDTKIDPPRRRPPRAIRPVQLAAAKVQR